MPSSYDSNFWHQRARETSLLAEQMRDAAAKAAMMKLARKYERIAFRCAYDESRIAFDSAREALRVSEGAASPAQIASLTKTVDSAWEEMRTAGGAMEAFRLTHLPENDDAEGAEGSAMASSAW
ncbi:MAG: hypothetical protein ACYCZX_16370 [Rhodospirillaceae bacterium]